MRVRLIPFLLLFFGCGPISDFPAAGDDDKNPGNSPAGMVADAGLSAQHDGGSQTASSMDAGLDVSDEQDAAPPYDLDAGDAQANDAGDGATLMNDAGDGAVTTYDAGCHNESGDAGIPGVTIQIEGERCVFAYGQGGSFRYRVTLDRSLPYNVAMGSSCGFCGKYGSEADSLVRATVVGPGGASYCPTCDRGCCPPDRAGSYALSAQSLNGTLDWPAKSWNGPSDTSLPLGATFQRGASTVVVSLELPDGRKASAALPITIE